LEWVEKQQKKRERLNNRKSQEEKTNEAMEDD